LSDICAKPIQQLPKPGGPNASCDCALAAQNIMLAAH